MRKIFLGLGSEFDSGAEPGVAINAGGTVVEVHKKEVGYELYARSGTIDQMTVRWNDLVDDRDRYTKGSEPACALNTHGTVLEVHKNEAGDKLYSMVGQVSGTGITWGDSRNYDTDGVEPAIAINDHNVAVTVYRRDGYNTLRYRVGAIDVGDKEADFEDGKDFADGYKPKVALNNAGDVVAVWNLTPSIYYCVGYVTGPDTVDWGEVGTVRNGEQCGVALTDDGEVIVTLMYKNIQTELFQRCGRLKPGYKEIEWYGDAEYYDDGETPCVAAAGGMAVAIHQGEGPSNKLYFTTSILTDRANWMKERLARLGNVTLKNLVLPASHDAGMYTAGISVMGKTQELSVGGQLEYGIRYFDLRPKYDAGDDRIDIHHGPVEGPPLSEVLADIAAFAAGDRRELCIFDFSHFTDFGPANNSPGYQRFLADVEDALGPWLVRSKPSGVRLADLTLDDYVAEKTALLVVVDGDYPLNYPQEGFWVFRNSRYDDEENPYRVAEGDLRVSDKYSDDTDYETMRDEQLAQYEAYNGTCDDPADPNLVCDLFLLSWTLTPWTGVWFDSKDCNRHLGKVMADLDMPNSHGQIANLLYVDYCEFARVTDVALAANGTPHAD